MSLETFTGKVSDLVPTNPTGSDPRSQGDDHLRGIKQTIIGQSINCQIGQSATPANNFVMTAEADNGTMKLARGNSGATTQDVMTVADNGKPSFPQLPSSKGASNVSAEIPNGVVVKGGTIGSVSAGGAITVAFLPAFPTACSGIALTQVTGGVITTIAPFSVEDITADGFTVRNNWSGGAITGRYVAIGY